MCISKILTDLCVIRQNVGPKNTFANVVYNVLVVEKKLIDGKESVQLGSGSIKFKNNLKQLSIPFKIYADFECNVKGVESNNRDTNNLAVLLTKLFVLMIDLASQLSSQRKKCNQ